MLHSAISKYCGYFNTIFFVYVVLSYVPTSVNSFQTSPLSFNIIKYQAEFFNQVNLKHIFLLCASCLKGIGNKMFTISPILSLTPITLSLFLSLLLYVPVPSFFNSIYTSFLRALVLLYHSLHRPPNSFALF